ncbi:SLC45A1 (predicted) [Pycnogonum litorale]
MSDSCKCKLGRRRPFILFLSLLVILGLLLVGYARQIGNAIDGGSSGNDTETSTNGHKIASTPVIVLTIVGAVLLDLGADSCQAPSRAYMVDAVDESKRDLVIRYAVVAASAGSIVGSIIGGINWKANMLGKILGGSSNTSFIIGIVILIGCILLATTAYKELPLHGREIDVTINNNRLDQEQGETTSLLPDDDGGDDDEEKPLTFREYMMSVIFMPKKLRVLGVTNILSSMAAICYELFFTNFVGVVVFNGDPNSAESDPKHELYEQGIRWGSYGMICFYLGCFLFSLSTEYLTKKINIKTLYVGSHVVYTIASACMAFFHEKISILVLSSTAGVIYSTVYSIPVIIVTSYHRNKDSEFARRGLGTDVSVVFSTLFIGQCFVSFLLGILIKVTGTVSTTMWCASVCSGLATLLTTQVTYESPLSNS